MSRTPDTDKTAEGLWTARNRALVEMTAEDLALESGYSLSAIRKVEGGSNPHPSPAIMQAIFKALRARGAAQGKVIDEPPGSSSGGSRSEMAALVEALSRLAEEIRLSRAEELASRQEMMKALAALAGRQGPRETQAEAELGSPAGAQ